MEAHVRAFALPPKLEGRDTSFGESSMLNSGYLLDLYPSNDDVEEEIGTSNLAHERHAYTMLARVFRISKACEIPTRALKVLLAWSSIALSWLILRRQQGTTQSTSRYLRIFLLWNHFGAYMDTLFRLFIQRTLVSREPQSWVEPSLPLSLPGGLKGSFQSFEGKMILLKALEGDGEEVYQSTEEDTRKALHFMGTFFMNTIIGPERTFPTRRFLWVTLISFFKPHQRGNWSEER